MPYPFHLRASVALLLAGNAQIAMAAEAPQAMDVVVVTGSRTEQRSFDVPAAIDVVDSARIGDAQMRVNASEALAAVPGLAIQNRQNYAQDLQISSRGFGARSAFGVRGMRLITDGIPATMPDGQGQAATFNLDRAQRIEVLRGPFSALYGNHAGGTIALFTRDGKGRPSIELSLATGSDNTHKTDLAAQGQVDAIGYVIDASRFETDGYRAHSAATRDQSLVKLAMAPSATSDLTISANTLQQNDTQDPLGLTWASWQRDPRAGEIDTTDPQNPKRTFSERYDTRKSIHHQQLGVAYEQRLGDDRVRLVVYGGNRDVIQYQAFSKFVQAPPSQSGGVVDFDRTFQGIDINWQRRVAFAGGTLSTTVGVDYGQSTDARKGYENFIGSQFGVRGALRRDEDDRVASRDPYAQLAWQDGAWLLSASLRHSHLMIEVADHFISNGNDSGQVSYRHTTPVIAALYKLTPTLNVYANAARGFEAPTLNELFYSGAGAGFNFHLNASTSTHLETGIKAYLGQDTRVDVALFKVKTRDELVVDVAGGGRTSYRNAAQTLRQGAEVSMDSKLTDEVRARLALTVLDATYTQGFANVAPGRQLPGVARANLFGELAWKSADGKWGAAIEALASARIYSDDANIDHPAPGYSTVNANVQAKQTIGRWQLKQFARMNNLTGRTYIGSVIVGDANKRYYEAAPGRNWLVGLSANYSFL